MNYSHFQYMHLGTLFSWLKTTASNTIFGHSVKLFNWLTVGNNISYSQLICKLKNRKRARARQFNFFATRLLELKRYTKTLKVKLKKGGALSVISEGVGGGYDVAWWYTTLGRFVILIQFRNSLHNLSAMFTVICKLKMLMNGFK